VSEEAPKFVFSTSAGEWFRIVSTENGWDIKIPDDVTLTEAAQKFIETINGLMGKSS
jgi:hypothetical protein